MSISCLLGGVLAGLVGLAGCGIHQLATGDLKPPLVSLKAITVNPPASEDWPLACTLLIENPNPQPINIKGFDYELWLEGQRMVQGESLEALKLPARGRGKVVVPMLIKLPVIPKVLRGLFQKRKIAYEIAGSFRLGPGPGLLKLPFRFQGQITEKEGWGRLQEFFRPQT
ncbi:MAG: LEA type 2 family protein [Deltaproteobacteria bacterium]|nr:LEA type 2 family protein [Deltaproteobacteria bacterium]